MGAFNSELLIHSAFGPQSSDQNRFCTYFVGGFHAQTQFIGYGDEQRHNVGDAFARVSLVVLNGDRSILFDSQNCCRTIETIALHEIFDVRKVLLHLLERGLVLGEQFGAGGRVLGLRDTVFDQRLLQTLNRVDYRIQIGQIVVLFAFLRCSVQSHLFVQVRLVVGHLQFDCGRLILLRPISDDSLSMATRLLN